VAGWPAGNARAHARVVHRRPTLAGPQGLAKGTMANTARRKWSADVTRRSDALDLEKGVFALKDPRQIAASLRHSAETSRRKKTDAFRSALSMITFYINRAGTNLSARQRRILMRAKDELRRLYGREPVNKS